MCKHATIYCATSIYNILLAGAPKGIRSFFRRSKCERIHLAVHLICQLGARNQTATAGGALLGHTKRW